VKLKLISFLGMLIIRGLHGLLRVRHIDATNIKGTPQYIVVFWHAHLLLMLHCLFRRPIATMNSMSRDADYIVAVFRWYGVDSVRGGSSKGGSAALRELIRRGRAGSNLAFTPDGPRGPARVLKDGVIHAARATSLPIVPVAFAAKKKSCCGRGTGWSSRYRSPGRSISTVSRLPCRVMPSWRNTAFASRRPSTPWPVARNANSILSGRRRQPAADNG
jgi:lysophospholipid acyltransferase (LPLAT)-like uncharacterized protein